MKSVEEILDKHLLLMVGRAEQSYVSVEAMKLQPKYQATKDAMLEFAKLVLEEAAENAKADFVAFNVYSVNKKSITNTLNKYL